METSSGIEIKTLATLPEFHPGDDLPRAILEAAEREGVPWVEDTVLVIAQKVVSKVEGKIVDLRTIAPSAFASSFSQQHEKNARLVELILQQSRRIVKMDRGVLIAETRHGFVCANAGVDQSNVAGADHATVLPDDPDGSARAIRDRLVKATGMNCAVIISDTFGRPWRAGLVDVAIGAAGLRPIEDERGRPDRQGRALQATRVAVADEIAAAAGLLMTKAAGRPVALVWGFSFEAGDGAARELIRPPEEDLFR